MIWLTWRQFRAQAVAAAAALAAFGILLAVTGPRLASQYAASGITGCRSSSCGSAAHTFLAQLAVTSPYPLVYLLGMALILIAPAIVGLFWGAPLIARELEARTFNLAWTQSVTRRQWLAVKLALTGLAAMAVTEALSLGFSWWEGPIGRAIDLGGPGQDANPFDFGRFSSLGFASQGITPLGYAAFAFVLGTAAGTLIRRAVPAMAVTLVIFAAVQVAMPLWVRPNLIPPERTVASIEAAGLDYGNLTATAVPGQPGAWMLASGLVNTAGQPVTSYPAACGSPYSGKLTDPGQCLQARGYREAISYEPASRYWPLQAIETGMFLIVALALAWFCFWRLGRRRA